MSHRNVGQARRIWIQVEDYALPGSWQRQPSDQQDGQHDVRKHRGDVHRLKYRTCIYYCTTTVVGAPVPGINN